VEKSTFKKTKLCAIICGPSLSEAREQVKKAGSKADLLEFRIDQFAFKQVDAIRHLMEAASVPVMLTLRKRSHGGEFSGDEQQRLEIIRQLAVLNPSFLDIEYDVDSDFFEEMQTMAPGVEIICSYHDLLQMPEDLESLFELMLHKRASIYKLSVMAQSTIDSLRLLRFLQDKTKKGHRIIACCMGEYGTITRILGGLYGSEVCYATLHESLSTAPGQLTIEEMTQRYRIKSFNSETQVYGLIGDPVNRSPSHDTHNRVLKNLALNGVYCKFRISREELHRFIDYTKKLRFAGFSVTMPLKEAVMEELTEVSSEVKAIGAANTLKCVNRTVLGYNTDGKGALNAIEKHIKVKGKTLIIIGAGGSAKAIAQEAFHRGAHIIVINRTHEKAKELAAHVNGKAGSLNDFDEYASLGYDVLVNATSVGFYDDEKKLPVDPNKLIRNKVVLDVVISYKDTAFLQEARYKDCHVIDGYTMLRYQAVEQFLLWFGERLDREQVEVALHESFKS